MTMTTRVWSVSIPVADQDRALAFYTEVLGCELRWDVEVWPGARYVEVVPPWSSVGLVLLPPDSEIPVAVRLGTTNAETAHQLLREAGAKLHNDETGPAHPRRQLRADREPDRGHPPLAARHNHILTVIGLPHITTDPYEPQDVAPAERSPA
jgi:catechol 2,3-dioxygenase-like lactoylglutathione lyase family enzyme